MITYADLIGTETYRSLKENGEDWRLQKALDVAFGEADYRTHGSTADGYLTALESMTDGYLDALLWTSVTDESSAVDGDENYLDAGYSIDDVTPELRASVADHLLSVVVAHPLAVRLYGARRTFRALGPNTVAKSGAWDYFGHDYLLTRDHHGTGFWDRNLGELGKYLDQIATDNGGSEYANGGLMVTADGQIDA